MVGRMRFDAGKAEALAMQVFEDKEFGKSRCTAAQMVRIARKFFATPTRAATADWCGQSGSGAPRSGFSGGMIPAHVLSNQRGKGGGTQA